MCYLPEVAVIPTARHINIMNTYRISDSVGRRIVSKIHEATPATFDYAAVLALLDGEKVAVYDAVSQLIDWLQSEGYAFEASAVGKAAAREARICREALRDLAAAQETLQRLANVRWPN